MERKASKKNTRLLVGSLRYQGREVRNEGRKKDEEKLE
jgi:hypothetical protein